MVDDQDVGLARSAQIASVQTRLPERPARSETGIAIPSNLPPERIRNRERDLGAQTRRGRAGVLVEDGQEAGVPPPIA
jgi:hypothetical protein